MYMKRDIAIGGWLEDFTVLLFYRYFPEWRFARLFTIIVTVNCPMCKVMRIGLTSFLERKCSQPPVVYATSLFYFIIYSTL